MFLSFHLVVLEDKAYVSVISLVVLEDKAYVSVISFGRT